ncbi:cytochrome c oxidase subunit 3 [Dyella sp.]|jgi:cytochrome c oxidase subunit 3|uniref:cytochrome c oxidase subunit 3 n=1 Tax=Dyella sp. TaxID=1869338 RepID=UPI002D765406|nr:cytochrome c oxidase subunit 3 [Dyella sp.]HET6432784.1 cytochrome c oxidase subunit 3 [Dyella sp.]
MTDLARAHLQEQFDQPTQQKQAATLGMWQFLATEVLFFGVLFAAYTACRYRFADGFAEAARHTHVVFGSIETAVLLISSCGAALALRNVELGGRRVAAALLAGTAALGTVFLVLHGVEYASEYREGLVPGLRFDHAGPHARAVELFYCLYFLITGFHSLHVIIGVVLMTVMAVKAWRGRFGPGYATPLENAALYWHFVDIVWIFVYPMIYLVGRASA